MHGDKTSRCFGRSRASWAQVRVRTESQAPLRPSQTHIIRGSPSNASALTVHILHMLRPYHDGVQAYVASDVLVDPGSRVGSHGRDRTATRLAEPVQSRARRDCRSGATTRAAVVCAQWGARSGSVRTFTSTNRQAYSASSCIYVQDSNTRRRSSAPCGRLALRTQGQNEGDRPLPGGEHAAGKNTRLKEAT